MVDQTTKRSNTLSRRTTVETVLSRLSVYGAPSYCKALLDLMVLNEFLDKLKFGVELDTLNKLRNLFPPGAVMISIELPSSDLLVHMSRQART